MTQDTALNILKMGHNVYLTGAAGSGKTYVLNQYIKYLRENEIDIGVTASTGIAATHMGGVTIHSWTGLGIRSKLTEQDIDKLREKQYLSKRFEKVRVLIIDEISMMHHYRLDMVDELLRAFKDPEKPFGGIQVILCGDFFQLPPISRKGEPGSKFIYHSKVWRTAKFKICYLEEQHRQTDDESLRILNDIRNNEVSEDTIEKLRTRFKDKNMLVGGFGGATWGSKNGETVDGNTGGENFNTADFGDMGIGNSDEIIDISDRDVVDPKEVSEPAAPIESPDEVEAAEVVSILDKSLLSSKDDPALTVDVKSLNVKVEPTRLFTHNIDVDSVNDEALDGIGGEEFDYFMESYGNDVLVDTLKKSCLAPEHLRLKIGARVMFVKNNFEAGYVNGTLGVVADLNDDGPTIKVFSGELIKAEKETWEIEEDGKVKASITQFPLRLAWAITIHKSQGMSLDAVEVDLSRSFEKGMGYVALSRVRTLDGLTILGLNDMALRVHDEILMVDEKLRKGSERDEMEIENFGDNIQFLQKEYLTRIAPSEKEKRAKKLTTFEQTKMLIEENMALKKIAKERGVNEETIIDHIEKLIQEDPFFIETASYLRSAVPFKKQQLIREAILKAYPELSVEAGEFGSQDYDPAVYQKVALAPIKHVLGGKASYRDIRLIRALG